MYFEEMDDAPTELPTEPTTTTETPVKRGRGRPKGSKAKSKVCPKCGTIIE